MESVTTNDGSAKQDLVSNEVSSDLGSAVIVDTGKVREVAAMLKAIHAQEDRASATQKAVQVVEKLEAMRLGKAAGIVREGVAESLSYMAFPSEHWRCIRTNNPLERINREVRRRTRVVGAFPDGQSALMLVAARLRHVAGTQVGHAEIPGHEAAEGVVAGDASAVDGAECRHDPKRDDAGRVTATTYDALGRKTRVVEDATGIGRTTDFEYDWSGRLTKLTAYTDGTTGPQDTIYTYNGRGLRL